MSNNKIEKIYVCHGRENDMEIIEKILVRYSDGTYSYDKLPSFYSSASAKKKAKLRRPLYVALNNYMKKLTSQDNSNFNYLKNENVLIVHSNNVELQEYVDKQVGKLVIEDNEKSIKFDEIRGVIHTAASALSLLLNSNVPLSVINSWFSIDCFKDVVDKHIENDYLFKFTGSKTAKKFRLYFSYLMLALNLGLNISNLSVSVDKFINHKITLEKNNDMMNEYNNVMEIQEDILDDLDNPFSNKLVTTDDAVLNLLMESFNLNPFLNERDLEIALSLEKYIKNNPYLDYEELYVKFASVGIIHLNSENVADKRVSGSYLRDMNIITTYTTYETDLLSKYTYEDTLQHELIHSTGSIDNIMLDEGMTSLLQCEYFDYGSIQDAYFDHVLVTKIFCELIGSDKMLEAYSKNDINIIKNEMLKLNSNENDYNNLMKHLESCGEKFAENDSDYNEKIMSISPLFEPFLSDEFNIVKLDRINEYRDALGKDKSINNMMYFNNEDVVIKKDNEWTIGF